MRIQIICNSYYSLKRVYFCLENKCVLRINGALAMRFLCGRFKLNYLLHFSITLNFFFGILLFKSFYSTPKSLPIIPINNDGIHEYDSLPTPTIYIITATYPRLAQFAELTRLCHTFLHVKNIHWIVVEDASLPST